MPSINYIQSGDLYTSVRTAVYIFLRLTLSYGAYTVAINKEMEINYTMGVKNSTCNFGRAGSWLKKNVCFL